LNTLRLTLDKVIDLFRETDFQKELKEARRYVEQDCLLDYDDHIDIMYWKIYLRLKQLKGES